MTNSERTKAYKIRKQLLLAERRRQYYQKKKARLEQKPWEELTEKEKMARIRAQEKKMQHEIEEQKEKEERENARKHVARSRLRARLEEQYYMSKLEQGLSIEEAHMLGSLNSEGTTDEDEDIAILDKKILESMKRHKNTMERLRKERQEKEKQRLRDRLEQEYYKSQAKNKTSQGDTLQQRTPGSSVKSSELQVLGTGQEFIIVKQEDSEESSYSENSDSNSPQEAKRENPGPNSDKPPVGSLDSGRIWVPQRSSADHGNNSCNEGSSQESHNVDTNRVSTVLVVKTPSGNETKEAAQSNATNVENLQTENEADETIDVVPILKHELLN